MKVRNASSTPTLPTLSSLSSRLVSCLSPASPPPTEATLDTSARPKKPPAYCPPSTARNPLTVREAGSLFGSASLPVPLAESLSPRIEACSEPAKPPAFRAYLVVVLPLSSLVSYAPSTVYPHAGSSELTCAPRIVVTVACNTLTRLAGVETSESRIPCRNPSDALVSTSAAAPAVATPMNPPTLLRPSTLRRLETLAPAAATPPTSFWPFWSRSPQIWPPTARPT